MARFLWKKKRSSSSSRRHAGRQRSHQCIGHGPGQPQYEEGLADNALYADKAVLISQLLKTLPFKVFATSSIDALVHAVESALSPDSSASFRVFSYNAIELILKGYLQIRDHGPEARIPLMKDFLLASNWAGIASASRVALRFTP